MKPKDFVLWNKRLAAVYAFGVWTMVGSYGFYYYTTKRNEDVKMVVPEAQMDKELIDSSSFDDMGEKKKKTGFQVTNSVEYKKDFVPYSTRVYNFVTGISGTTPGPITEQSRVEK
ncbi:small integral membrane protein 26 [Spea bombifrons]|uniref:small integral membrane protein 26 n=1 Tax=Spea bombifrons TaxID=233779 RepID=UPI00234A470D|nr:small integral membrane protein 26 [Spea bombifrons]